MIKTHNKNLLTNMNKSIEFHDSTLSKITQDNEAIVLHFDKAYIHQSEWIPGIDKGTGWVQSIDVHLSQAKINILPEELPIDLDNGHFIINNKKLNNGINLPLNHSGKIEVYLITNINEEIIITAKSVISIEKSEL